MNSMAKKRSSDNQRGAVSLFVVVFAAMLITVVVVGFVRLMVHDEQQASTLDLSQSAYDSAQAGVEDGKRALVRYENICESGDSAACTAALAKLTSDECNVSLDGIVNPVGGEVKVQQSVGDSALDQAYTCVKIDLQTDDYLGSLQANSSVVVPLDSGDATFNTIVVEWYSSQDLQSTSDLSVNLPMASASSYPLVNQSAWPANRPSIMRAQLMQFGSGFRLTDFDDTNSSGESNANTLFLGPSSVGTTSKSFSGNDTRLTPTGSVQAIRCINDLSAGGYACRTTLTLPTPVTGGDRTAFLRLTSMYNAAHYRVTLQRGGTPVKFDGVQPAIDSTGRANDLFRRVVSRVEMRDTAFPYPEAAVDVTGNFCKDFLVTNQASDYANSCQP